MADSETYQRLDRMMADLESVLKDGGLWAARVPPPRALQSVQPFCVDTLAFTAWLQWVFIPRVHRLVEAEEDLPPHSDILPYAEECLAADDPATGRILEIIDGFDALINNNTRLNAIRH